MKKLLRNFKVSPTTPKNEQNKDEKLLISVVEVFHFLSFALTPGKQRSTSAEQLYICEFANVEGVADPLCRM